MSPEVRPDPVDTLVDVYVDWREECVTVQHSYHQWKSVPGDERSLAFAAYSAALDREERAARAYRENLERVSPRRPRAARTTRR